MRANRTGFTIVELTLAIAFVGILLIVVVTTAVGLGRTYQKGMTLRDVNQAGREVSDSMRRDIAMASPSQLKVILLPTAAPETARICTGEVSYLINFAEHLNNSAVSQQISYDGEPVHLTRVADSGGVNCNTNASGQYSMVAQGENPQELLGSVDNDKQSLAVHDFRLESVNKVGDESQLLKLSVRIGTNQVDSVDNDRCKNPNQTTANFDYCSLYDFETIIRAGYRSAK